MMRSLWDPCLFLNTMSGLLLMTRSLNRASERLILPSDGPLAPSVFSETLGTCCLKTSGVIRRLARRWPAPRPGLQVNTPTTHTVAKTNDTGANITDCFTQCVYTDWCSIVLIVHRYVMQVSSCYLQASVHLSHCRLFSHAVACIRADRLSDETFTTTAQLRLAIGGSRGATPTNRSTPNTVVSRHATRRNTQR